MAGWVKVYATKPDKLVFDPWESHGGVSELPLYRLSSDLHIHSLNLMNIQILKTNKKLDVLIGIFTFGSAFRAVIG